MEPVRGLVAAGVDEVKTSPFGRRSAWISTKDGDECLNRKGMTWTHRTRRWLALGSTWGPCESGLRSSTQRP